MFKKSIRPSYNFCLRLKNIKSLMIRENVENKFPRFYLLIDFKYANYNSNRLE